MLWLKNQPTRATMLGQTMQFFDGMDRKLFVGAFLFAWYVAYKSMGLL